MATLDIRITSICPPGSQGGTRAYTSTAIDGCFTIRGIKVVEGGKDGLFVSMPSRKNQDGYKEVCFPVTAEFRKQLYSGVLNTYHRTLTMTQIPAAPQRAAPRREAIGQQMAGTQLKTSEYQDNGETKNEEICKPCLCCHCHESHESETEAYRAGSGGLCRYRHQDPDCDRAGHPFTGRPIYTV